jgi:tRNA U55 pseudouridine synthase TruB
MGLIKEDINIEEDINISKIICGEQKMEYPPFSSVPIKEHKNKPYWYCTLNKMKVNIIPTKEINIYDIKILEKTIKTKEEIIEIINERINKVTSLTFRQREILEKWNTIENKTYEIYKMEIKISSGGYVRNIANNLYGCAFDIERIEYCD